MSESCAVEVYENEVRKNRGWIPHSEFPFVLKATLTPCLPLDEIGLPSDEWQWATNWKISKMPGVTDADGWEYASRFSRFKLEERAPKSEAKWKKARRRLWIRVMRRETAVKASELSKVLPKIQLGLSSVHSARLKIEEIMKLAPEAADSDQMRSLVTSVNKNIADILAVIDQAEKSQEADNNANGNSISSSSNTSSRGMATRPAAGVTSNSSAVLKKLRNDVLREEIAIERALEGKSTPIPIASSSGSMKANPTMSSSVAGSMRSGSFANVPNAPQRTLLRGQSHRTMRSDTVTSSTSTSSVGNGSAAVDVSQIVSSKAAVKSGAAGAFNPSIFNTPRHNAMGADGPEDGMFVDRTTHELLIEQKLIPVDEMTVMQEIIDDRHQEIQKINKGIAEINEMFNDLSLLVKAQDNEVRQIYDNIEESNVKTKEAFAHIVEASKLQRDGQCTIS